MEPIRPDDVPLAVRCRASHKGEEYPLEVKLGEQTSTVVRVLAEWLEQTDGRTFHRFRLYLDDGRRIEVAHDLESGRWSLVATAP